MGSNIPPKPSVDQIVWFENHLPLWTAAPTTFGTTAAACTALTTTVTNARKAYNNAQAARDASKAATTGETMAMQAMLTPGRAMVNTMKSFIEASGNTALWSSAGLEAPNGPGTAPDPVAPTMLSATLDSHGDVIVDWKASQPRGVSGVVYSVQRAIDTGGGVGPYTLLDTVGGKQFIDMAVPFGTRTVQYTIKAKRGTQMSGWSEALTVQFGRIDGGGFAITSSETGPVGGMKMAA